MKLLHGGIKGMCMAYNAGILFAVLTQKFSLLPRLWTLHGIAFNFGHWRGIQIASRQRMK